MRATARGSVAVSGATAGGTTGATVGGSIGGPVGAYVGGTGGAAIGGYAAGRAYDAAAGLFGGGGGKNAVELDASAYQLAPLRDWIDEALWRGASWAEIHAASAEGDRVTASLDPRVNPDAVWPGLPTRTIRELNRASAVQRLVGGYPVRPGRPAPMGPPVIARSMLADVAPPNRNATSSATGAVVIGALAGAVLGAGGAWIVTRSPRRRRYRLLAMGGAGLVGAAAGGYGGGRWSK